MKLNQLLKQGGDDTIAAAWTLFNQLVERGDANLDHCNIMLKACHDSTQMKERINNSMKKAGVKPNVMTYNTYVRALVLEGNVTEAKRVVKDMQSRGIQPNQNTNLIFQYNGKI